METDPRLVGAKSIGGNESLQLFEPVEDQVDSRTWLIPGVGVTQNHETLPVRLDVPVTGASTA